METKLCSCCRLLKSKNEFSKNSKMKDGFCHYCKDCKRLADRKYNKKHNEKILLKKKEYRDKNKERIKDWKREYRKNNKDKIYEGQHKCYLERKEYYKNKSKEYAKNNRDKTNKRAYLKYRSDINFKLSKLFRIRVYKLVKGYNRSLHTLELLGCSLEKLKIHLQQTAIKNGYQDFDINTYSGKDFHIDHIKLCSSFDLSKEEEQKKCFHWSNLQVLTAQENWEKKNR